MVAAIERYTDADILAALPHPTARPGQIEAIRSILNSFDEGNDYVFLEAPTGAGKSALGIAISEFYTNCYYLTIQKILQSQISRDYAKPIDDGSNLIELKGRNAYPCTFYSRYGQAMVDRGGMNKSALEKALNRASGCDNGYCHSIGKFRCKACFPPRDKDSGVISDPDWSARNGAVHSTCPYYEQVFKAVAGRKVLMNFSSFLYQTAYTTRFKQRDLMIIDEAHHIEEQLMDFVSFTFSDRILIERGIQLPECEEPGEYAIWFHENGILEVIDDLTRSAKTMGQSKEEEELIVLRRKLDKFMECISDGMDQWVVEFKKYNPSGMPGWRSVTMKPIFVKHFAKSMLFSYGIKVLLMSATILDARIMASALNVPKDKMTFHRMPNNFPVKNRPIFIIPAVRAVGGKDKQGTWGPTMVKWIDGIVRKYKDHRGIIHTHNFAIARMAMEKCSTRHRFIFQDNYRDKESMLVDHSSRSDSVLIAPAMHEGLDLKDDLSRFAIICKTPYPNFFDDKQLAKRIECDRRYLNWLVALRLVQAYGRSIRSADDWAHTYIIDGAVTRFLAEAHRLIPDWFTEAIHKVKI